MSKADAEHFDDYSQQTEVKHKILAGYFKPYLSVLKNQAAWFHYVDGFAGRGEYSGGNIGSPLIALDKLEEAGVLDRATVSLVESRPDHFAELQKNIASSTLVSRLAEPVFVHQGEFGDHLPAILQSPIYERQGSVATFSFVDPCGIKGIAMSDLVELLQQDFGELLLFFNYSGINRILGAMIAGEMKSDVAETFFGSEHVVKGLMATLNSANSSEQKEIEILSVFVNTLRERAGVDYFFPFRFQPRGSDRTSHYIIHYTRHSLGFTIMKHVMWEAAKGDGEEYGRPELTAEMQGTAQHLLFRDDIAGQMEQIIEELKAGHRQVSHFTKSWVARPEDYFSEKVYRQMLMDLEQAKRLNVYDKENRSAAPANKRKANTLAGDYWLRLSNTS